MFRLQGDAYVQTNTLTPEQYKVMNAIKNCRTSVLGGHVEQCDQCHAIHCAYNSCRNRHCPKCESFKAAQWLGARQAELLPIRYFHVVFTLPHELNNLVLYNKKILYNLLFESAWKTLNTLGRDPKRLHGEMGMLSILHTWGQNLSQHNHVHCIVPGGALRSTGKWSASKNYLFPEKVLSKLFRGIFITQLRHLYQQEALKLPDKFTETLFKKDFDALLNQLMQKDWVVYAKPPFTDSQSLLNYLGRYTHKIAISNHRILEVDEKSVTFQWRDYADDNKVKIMQLAPDEFMRRFLSHVVPTGFMRIRSFGFLANACKANKIAIIKKQLGDTSEKPKEKKDVKTLMLELTGKDITLCPICKIGQLKRAGEIPSKWGKTIVDTS
ncbi:MAG: IS91 family transposase [Proteobacteria bacterium]|nr:IS91 family transposase [Pseudomonadota bacterium]